MRLQACQSFKQWELEVLRTLTKDFAVRQSDELAYKLFILLEGLASIAQVTKETCPLDITSMANEVIEKHIS